MKKLLNGLMLFVFLFLAAPAFAQDAPLTLDKIDEWLNNIRLFLFSAGILIAVIFMILAGVRWATAGDDPKKIEQAKGMLKSAVIGAAIILGVGVILSTIAGIF